MSDELKGFSFMNTIEEENYTLKSELRSYKESHALMQKQIAQLEQEVKKYENIKNILDTACIPWGFTFKTESSEEMQQRIDELEKENAELKVMLKPDGYVDGEEHYHTPEDYVNGLLTIDSKVGEQFSITPYVLLPEETYVLTKLDDDSFEIEQLQEQK